jgi:hypothetical protein
MFATASRHAILTAITDPAVRPALQQQLDTSFGAVVASFGLDARGNAPAGLSFVCRTLPVGVKLVAYGGNTATVQVWTAGLVGLAGQQSTKPVAEAWSTGAISLRWTLGDWKWVTFTQHDGPTPVSGLQPASGAAAIADATRSFAGLRYAR